MNTLSTCSQNNISFAIRILVILVLQYKLTYISDILLLKVLYLLHLPTYLLLVFQKRVNDLWEVRNYTTAFFVLTRLGPLEYMENSLTLEESSKYELG